MSEAAALSELMTPEQLEALGEEIAMFGVRVDVAQHALLTRLRLFDAHEAWGPTGALSCAQWLSWRTHIGPTAAREKVRVARALGTLDKTDALFGRGELSYSKVRAITRVATPDTEQDFINVALHTTASQLERLVRAYKRCDEAANGPNEVPLNQRRFVRRSETPSGMIRIEMQLPPEEAYVVWEAMQSANGRDEHRHDDIPRGADSSPNRCISNSQPEAEASAEACRSGVRLAFGSRSAPHPVSANDSGAHEQQRADAIVDVARAYLKHQPRTLGSAYELVVITTKEQLEQDPGGGPGGVGGFMRDGTPVPLHVARMLACDGARVDVVIGKDGELLDVGRSTRAIPSAISRALWLRDGGCRVPGCERKRHLHAHHIQPWAEGGPTRLSNLVHVCSGHHRLIHEGELSTEIRDRKITFVDQSGRAIPSAPPSAATGQDLEQLERFLREGDIHIDPSTNAPKWDGTLMDLADSLTWMFNAHRPRTTRRGTGTPV